MQTTEVPAANSAAEISGLLVRAGASQITTRYQDGKLSGIGFTMAVAGAPYSFELPARTEPVYRMMLQRKPYSNYFRGTRQQYEEKMRTAAERVGWRQLFRWVQAQVAVIDAGMVSAHEVFLPYMLVGRNQTMLQAFEEHQFKMLTNGEG